MPQAVLPSGVIAAGAFLIPCLLCVPRNGIADVVVIAVAAAGALWIGHHHPLAERHLRNHPRQRAALILGCSLLLATLAIGDLVSARWWVMDDHEVAELLGSDHRIEFGEMVAALAQHSEVGQLGSGRRARPSYYVIRHVEAWLWADNLALWYTARVFVLGGIFALCWYLLWRWVGGIDAGLLLLMIFCWRMWSDLWSRIGSSETYAMMGIMLSMLGLVLLARRDPVSTARNAIAWLLIAVGAVVAMGSKENFLIMVPATLGYALWLWFRGRMNVIAALGTLAVTAFGVFMAVAVVGTLSAEGGVDIYANQRSVGSLLMATIRCLTVDLGAIMLLAVLVLAVFARRIRDDSRLRRLLPQTQATTWTIVALLAMFVSQFAFYNEFNAFSNRYAFPAALAPLLMVPLLFRLRLRYRRLRGDDRRSIRRTQFALRLAVVLLVAGLGLTMQRHANRHVRQTTAFTDQVVRVADLCAARPDSPVVFFSHRPIDYESLYSVARFLRFYDVPNPIYLRLEGYNGDLYRDGLDGALTDRLQSVSRAGDEVFRPIGELSTGQPQIGVGFSNTPAEIACVAQFPCWK